MSKPPPAATTLVSAADRQLLDACLAGDERGWEAFIDRFGGLFGGVAAAVARQGGRSLPPSERDDLVGEMVLACIANDGATLRSFAGRASLATYLTVIARRVALRRFRRESTACSPRSDHLAADAVAGRPGDAPMRLDDRDQIETLLGKLDRDEARLVRLHHLEARSYGEISRATGLPLGSIGPALSRARAKLRQFAETSAPPARPTGPADR